MIKLGDYNTLKGLNTRTITFNNLDVDTDSIASAKFGNIVAQIRRIDKIESLHFYSKLVHAGHEHTQGGYPPPTWLANM